MPAPHDTTSLLYRGAARASGCRLPLVIPTPWPHRPQRPSARDLSRVVSACVAAVALVCAATANAQPTPSDTHAAAEAAAGAQPPPTAAASGQAEGSGAGIAPLPETATPSAGASVTVGRRPLDSNRSVSRVDQDDLRIRLPRSAPDALRDEPGVFVQQTAHGQGSAFIRGRTGQQTVLLFDGVRLNNALFRQGPNQYFFTIDSATIDRIDVLRGSASVRYGSDAIGGVIQAVPIAPTPRASDRVVEPHALARLRWQSADDALGARGQVDAQLGPVGLIGGVGYRSVGRLRSGGAVRNPLDGEIPQVPRFAADGRTQLGTGFDELTADLRLSTRLGPVQASLAAYIYQQYDAPRTDQCPAAFAPYNECLTYDEQFRTLVYGVVDGDLGAAARDFRAHLSWQRQHERRALDRPSSFTVNGGRDDVDSYGLAASARTRRWALKEAGTVRLRWGADAYFDRVDSLAWLEFSDVDILRFRSRGQYIDGSRYVTGGVFAQAEADLVERLEVRLGARLAHARAVANADPESGTLAVDGAWTAPVAGGGIAVAIAEPLRMIVNLDQGFRAPNLDDLTSRQQTGPGFQIENADLRPERALTAEVGFELDHEWITFDAWAYRSTVVDAIARSTRDVTECPANTPQCGGSWARFQLVNLDGTALIIGAEGAVSVHLPQWFELGSTISWARGTGPNPERQTEFTAAGYRERTPLSRIPPLNGTFTARWLPVFGGVHRPWVGAVLRWATLQDRLAVNDRSDARIPLGGTPGYTVADLQVGYRWGTRLACSMVVENLTDAAWRSHGSSVNGPGRGVIVQLEGGF